MYPYIAAILLGAISKFLDDRALDNYSKIIILISIPLWIIYFLEYLTIGLAILLGVYLAGKIDTPTLNLYFLAAILALIISLFIDINQLRLAPFIIYLIALYYDEKDIKIFGKERILIYIALFFILALALIMKLVGLDINLELYIKDFFAIFLFDIGYITTARIIEK